MLVGEVKFDPEMDQYDDLWAVFKKGGVMDQAYPGLLLKLRKENGSFIQHLSAEQPYSVGDVYDNNKIISTRASYALYGDHASYVFQSKENALMYLNLGEVYE